MKLVNVNVDLIQMFCNNKQHWNECKRRCECEGDKSYDAAEYFRL